jgi:SAM-dependent methyltransferase
VKLKGPSEKSTLESGRFSLKMNYGWSYAAANSPVASHLYRQPAKSSSGKSGRSNSTRAGPVRRSRIPGHSRASSSTESSRSKDSYDQSRYGASHSAHSQPQQPHAADPAGQQQHHHHQHPNQHRQPHPPPPQQQQTTVPNQASSSLANSPIGTAVSSNNGLHDSLSSKSSHPSAVEVEEEEPVTSRGEPSDWAIEDGNELEQEQGQSAQRERMLATSSRYNNHHPNARLQPIDDSAEASPPTLDRYNSGNSGLSDPSQASTISARAPRSPRSPAPPAATTTTAAGSLQRRPSANSAAAAYVDRRVLQHAAMLPESGGGGLARYAGYTNAARDFGRAESLSSGHTSGSRSTMMGSEQHLGSDTSSGSAQRPFVMRNGRQYLADPTIAYPLPVDLHELNRQSLRTLLLFQLFGGPVVSPVFQNKPPTRVLEVGCGSGFWSMMCHRYYARHGHSSISFTGMDVAPIPMGSSSSSSTSGSSSGSQDANNRASTLSTTSTIAGDGRPDKDMKWRFVQHDLRRMPWPFPDNEFDLVMVKDMSLANPISRQQDLMDEYIRILRPGGTLEIWESDHTIRMLRPHVPESPPSASAADDDDDEQEMAASIGAYVMTSNTPLSPPLNSFLVEYNGWLARALEMRNLSPVPCTVVGSMLVQEADDLGGLGSRRLAVPLSEVRWEREGVGGVVTKDGKGYIDSDLRPGENKGKDPDPAKAPSPRRSLTAGQAALRRTALLTVAQMVQGLEGPLREVSGKSQDEWDSWVGKMMNDLMRDGGASWGECLEVGAWWARKKKA